MPGILPGRVPVDRGSILQGRVEFRVAAFPLDRDRERDNSIRLVKDKVLTRRGRREGQAGAILLGQ